MPDPVDRFQEFAHIGGEHPVRIGNQSDEHGSIV
jgi:hypothetical protein